jgi:hypothetical protein
LTNRAPITGRALKVSREEGNEFTQRSPAIGITIWRNKGFSLADDRIIHRSRYTIGILGRGTSDENNNLITRRCRGVKLVGGDIDNKATTNNPPMFPLPIAVTLLALGCCVTE